MCRITEPEALQDSKMKFVLAALFAIIAAVSAFHVTAPASTKMPRMSMLFNFGKKETTEYKVGQGTANRGTYVPDGLTKEQYEKFLKAEEEKKQKIKSKFPKGKVTESLTEWVIKEAKKGNSPGPELNRKGHKMVKTKYEGWYTNESPV